MKTKHLFILLLIAFAGLLVSGYLTARHFEILKEGFEQPSICNLSAKFDCDSVIISRFAKLGPVSVSGLGFLFYAYLTLSLAYALINREEGASTLSFPLVFSYPALAFSIYLALVSSLIIKSFCLFCISLYIITFVFFICIHFFFPKTPSRLAYLKDFFQINTTKQSIALRSSFFGHSAFLVLFFVISFAALYANEKKYAEDLEDFDHKAFLDFHYIQPQVTLDTKDRPYWGNPNALVKIVEFSDFECPFCKKAASTLKPYLKQHLANVQFIFVNYPLDKSCNDQMQRDLHQNACLAASAAYCAHRQNKFWEMHDRLFAEQPKFSLERFMGFARDAGLDSTQYNQCMESPESIEPVKNDIALGKTAQIQGTPAVFVNGRVFKEWFNPVKLNLLIEEEMKRVKK